MVDVGFVVDMILLDFSKAFHVVIHSIILTKLQMLGIGSKLVSGIRESLYGRKMCVKVAGKLSSLKNVNRDVAQKSVLDSV